MPVIIKKNMYTKMEQSLKYIKCKKQYRMIDKKMDTTVCVRMGEKYVCTYIRMFVYIYTPFLKYIQITSRGYTRNTLSERRVTW